MTRPTSRGRRQPREDKIAAIGVRIRHWVSFHGISINVEPDLSHYAGIVPCGIAEHGVTSLVDLGLPVTMADLDMALAETFDEVFGLLSEDTRTVVLSEAKDLPPATCSAIVPSGPSLRSGRQILHTPNAVGRRAHSDRLSAAKISRELHPR